MVDIFGINSTPNQPNRVTDRPVSKASSSKTKETTSSSSTTSSDRIEISSGAKEAQSINRLITVAQAQPEVRADAVARAKERLENGEYKGVEVSRQAARRILGLK